jgi:hypothetical protein
MLEESCTSTEYEVIGYIVVSSIQLIFLSECYFFHFLRFSSPKFVPFIPFMIKLIKLRCWLTMNAHFHVQNSIMILIVIAWNYYYTCNFLRIEKTRTKQTNNDNAEMKSKWPVKLTIYFIWRYKYINTILSLTERHYITKITFLRASRKQLQTQYRNHIESRSYCPPTEREFEGPVASSRNRGSSTTYNSNKARRYTSFPG